MSLKRFSLAFVIVIMSMFSIQSASASQHFVDTPDYASNEINYLVNKGVIQGYTENGKRLFKPHANVTRWQVAKMVIKGAGIQVSQPSKSSFTDVKAGTEESMYVEAATKLGIIEPTSKTTFSPHKAITRNEMAKALAVAFKIPASKYANLEVPFTDVSSSNVYYKYISAIYYNGITQGSDGKYLPNNALTRSQFALFVARAASKDFRLELPVQGVTVPNPADAIMQVKATTDGLHVRSSAVFTGTSNIIGKVNTGHVFNVYEIGADYYKVDYDGRYAYVYKTYLEEVNATQPKPPVTQPEPPVTAPPSDNSGQLPSATTIGIATVNNLNIREQASVNADVIGKINRGTKVDVLSLSGSWAEVSYEGTVGYISKTYLRLVNKSGSAVAGRIIVIDPGHGGKDPGAVSGSAVEKTIVMNTANKLKQKLEAAGAIVKMTRTGDTYPSLEERVQFAKNNYGEIFISIHTNSATNASAQGTETYHSISANDNQKEDVALATFINNEIVKNANMKDRGVRSEDYYVIRNLYIPAVLVELGFLSNSEDRSKLTSDQYVEIFAQSIYNGITKYYSQK